MGAGSARAADILTDSDVYSISVFQGDPAGSMKELNGENC